MWMLASALVSIFGSIIFGIVLYGYIKPEKYSMRKYITLSVLLNIMFWLLVVLPYGVVPIVVYGLFMAMAFVYGIACIGVSMHYQLLWDKGIKP